MDILKLINNKVKNNNYFTSDFLTLFDNFVPFIKKNKKYESLDLTNLSSWRNEGDFLSLMNELNIDYKYLPIVLRFNDILDNGDLTDQTLNILMPKIDLIENLYNTNRTISKK